MKKPNTIRNVPLSMPADLLRQVDRAAKSTNTTRSATMREAMRLGLPILLGAKAFAAGKVTFILKGKDGQ